MSWQVLLIPQGARERDCIAIYASASLWLSAGTVNVLAMSPYFFNRLTCQSRQQRYETGVAFCKMNLKLDDQDWTSIQTCQNMSNSRQQKQIDIRRSQTALKSKCGGCLTWARRFTICGQKGAERYENKCSCFFQLNLINFISMFVSFLNFSIFR